MLSITYQNYECSFQDGHTSHHPCSIVTRSVKIFTQPEKLHAREVGKVARKKGVSLFYSVLLDKKEKRLGQKLKGKGMPYSQYLELRDGLFSIAGGRTVVS